MSPILAFRAIALSVLAALWVAGTAPTAVRAQGVGGWSTPAQIAETVGTMSEPVLTADQTGGLHAFWTYHETDSPGTIFYSSWNGEQWDQPVDIAVGSGPLFGPRATVDDYGRIHLIWRGANNGLFYSSAESAQAATARGWSAPRVLVQSNAHADIVAEGDILHVVYPQLLEGGIGYIRSDDGGETWTSPVLVAEPVKDGATTEFTRLAIDAEGVLHVVWTELILPSGYPPLGVAYSRSSDDGLTWSEPFELAGDDYLEVDIATASPNTIYAAWNAMVSVSGRYYRWSQDAGETWSDVGMLAPRELGGGSTNPPELAVDSGGVVHAVINTQPGGRAGTDATMYVSGRDGQWTTPLDISQQAPEYIGFGNEMSVLAVLLGNQIHVLFVDNNGTRVWHTWRYSAANAIKPVASSTLAASLDIPLAVESPTQVTAAVPTPRVLPSPPPALSSVAPAPGAQSASTAILISVAPVLLLVGGIVLFRVSRKR